MEVVVCLQSTHQLGQDHMLRMFLSDLDSVTKTLKTLLLNNQVVSSAVLADRSFWEFFGFKLPPIIVLFAFFGIQVTRCV